MFALPGLLFGQPLPANSTNLKSVGQVRRRIHSTTKLPYWTLSALAHATLTAGVPYQIICNTTDIAVSQAPATTGNSGEAQTALIGVATEAATDGNLTEFIIAGYVYNSATPGTVHKDDCVEVLNAGVVFVDEGTNGGGAMTETACGIAMTDHDATTFDVWLFGIPVGIKAA